MGNNNEIRKRMETYRKVLLAVVWFVGIAELIGGAVMLDNYSLRPFGIALLIVSILGSIIGHFLVNVGLAIPFILLNNGDYLAAIVPEGKHFEQNKISTVDDWVCKNCNHTNRKTALFCNNCGQKYL